MPNDRARSAAEEFNRFAVRAAAPSRCDPTLAFETPMLGRALALWQEKAVGREIPSRRDMGARALKAFLPHVTIVDVVGEGAARRYRFRLLGTAVADLFGNLTGKFVDEAIVSPFRERWSAIMSATLDAGAPLRFFGRVEYNNRDYLSLELLLAPLSDESAEAILLVGSARASDPHVFNPL